MRAGGLIEIIYRNNCVYKQGGSSTNDKGGTVLIILVLCSVFGNDTNGLPQAVNLLMRDFIRKL